MKKIDIHCHTSNRAIRDVATTIPNIQAIETLMDQYDIEQTVLLATYFPHKQSGITNFRLYDWIRDNPKFVMFGSMDFKYYPKQGINELEEMAERDLISGIKIYTCYQDIDISSSIFNTVLGIAKKYGLPMMFHTGLSYASMRKYNTSTIASMHTAKMFEGLVADNPSIPFILSHMSKPFFEEIYEVCKTYPNAYTDMSGLIDSKFDKVEIPSTIEVIRKFLEICGPKKLLFGTDFPVQTHEHSILFVEEAMRGFAEVDKQLVYYENANQLII
jgi:predicted TIM-barrel fold metal-dependent hydrolase